MLYSWRCRAAELLVAPASAAGRVGAAGIDGLLALQLAHAKLSALVESVRVDFFTVHDHRDGVLAAQLKFGVGVGRRVHPLGRRTFCAGVGPGKTRLTFPSCVGKVGLDFGV